MTKAKEAGSGNSPRRSHGITIIPGPTAAQLAERQISDYRAHREKFIEWVVTLGKDPERGEGYAKATADIRCARVDRFYRWVWEQEDGYTTRVTYDHADEYMRELAYSDFSQDSKANTMKALKTLFRWRAFEMGEDEWEPELTFSNDTSTTNPRDYLSVEERQKLRETVLEYGSVPAYNSLSPEERDDWKEYLAQRFIKPKDEVGPDDFDRANSWKFPSLLWTALDTGLRPIEVERATTKWVDAQSRVLRIPKEESSKNSDNWTVSLTDRTAEALSRWLREREQYEMYADTDTLWLTRQANPYGSHALNHVLRKLCDQTGIDTENRDVSWYSIRHSVGTFMAREEGLAAAQAQLRHRSSKTTLRYDHAPPEDRRDALNRMG